MQVTVFIPPADSQGDDIVDALLTTDLVGRARGTREIDYESTDRTLEACQCPAHDFMATGSLVGVTEAAERWPGMIRYWSLTLTLDAGPSGSRFTADTRLDVERETT